MKKNSIAISSQKRASKKFQTSVKNLSSSKKEDTGRTNNSKVRNSSYVNKNMLLSRKSTVRKSVTNTAKKNNEKVEDNKRKSTVKRQSTKITKSKFDSKKSITSNKSLKNGSKISKNIKPKSKSVAYEMKIYSKDSKINKPSDIRSSEGFNSINDENEIINSKNVLNNEEKSNSNNNPEQESENDKNITAEKSDKINNPIKNELLKQKVENEYNNLIKDSNDKIKGIYEFENENKENNNTEMRLRNQKVESSDYITEKNKNMIRNLLFLLDKKSDDKKADKNIFRSQLNALDKNEKNKLLEALYKTRKEIFKIKWDEENKNINPSRANKKLNEIYNFVFEQKKNNSNKINDIYNINTLSPMKKQYPSFYNNRYFLDYINGIPPSESNFNFYPVKSGIFNNLKNENNDNNPHKLSHSYEPKFQVMKKNNLIVEYRDKRYLNYNYGSLVNIINNKLDGYISTNDFYKTFRNNSNNSVFTLCKYNYRDINRNRRMQNLYNSINADINSMNSLTNYGKSDNYNLRNSIF